MTELKEKNLNYYKTSGVSNITKRGYKQRKEAPIDPSFRLSQIKFVQGKHLRLSFWGKPSQKDVKPLRNNAKTKHRANNYTVEIEFENIEEILDIETLEDLEVSEIQKKLQEIFDKCDLKFYSDDPSFYYQGFWETLDKVNSAIYPFEGPQGDTTWETRHTVSGGLIDSKYRITKHIAQVLLSLNKRKSVIATWLHRGNYDIES